MLFKSREQQVLDHVKKEIEARLDNAEVPFEIKKFLLDKWSYLLAGIFFRSGDQHPDWEAGWQTVDALLWSLAPKQDKEETGQLLRLLPTLLERLEDGCDVMEYEAGPRDALFSLLSVLHANVVGSAMRMHQVENSSLTQLRGVADIGMTDEELANLVQENAVKDGHGSSGAAVDSTGLDHLKLGDAMRLLTADGEKLLFLQWVSPTGRMYLFADEGGLDTVSLTRARLLDRLSNGEARLI